MKRYALVVFALVLVCGCAEGRYWTPVQVSVFSPIQVFPRDWEVYGANVGLFYGEQLSVWGLNVGLVNTTGRVVGIELSGMGTVGEMVGVQIGGFGSIADSMTGVQVSPSATAFKEIAGLQLGLIGAINGGGGGGQISLVNAGGHAGFQVGLWNTNWGGPCLQLGLMNFAPEGPIPFLPLVNFSWGKAEPEDYDDYDDDR